MAKVQVFRVEDCNGTGPYNGTWELHGCLEYTQVNPHSTPGPMVEETGFGFCPPRNYIYGFALESQAKEWFAPVLEALYIYDFELSVYEVEDTDVIRCPTQVAFRREETVLVGRKELVP